MGKRQREVFRKSIQQTEGQLVMMISSVYRIFAHIGQDVMHPTHIPFHREAQTSGPGRSGDLRPGGRFLGHHDRSGMLLMGDGVKFPEKIDGFKIFIAAIHIGNPVIVIARIVQVKHRRDGVDP